MSGRQGCGDAPVGTKLPRQVEVLRFLTGRPKRLADEGGASGLSHWFHDHEEKARA
jgi:hypothetical protein